MLILDKFFLKYEGGGGGGKVKSPEQKKLKKPSLIRVKKSFLANRHGKKLFMAKN